MPTRLARVLTAVAPPALAVVAVLAGGAEPLWAAILGAAGTVCALLAARHDAGREAGARESGGKDGAEPHAAFLTAMNHELRTPLNAVIGFAEMLRAMPALPERKRQEYLDAVLLSARRLMAVVNDVLEMARCDAGRLDVSRRPFDLAAVVGDCADAARAAAPAEVAVIAPAREPLMLVGDEPRVRQALLNLVSNAVKFTDRGRIEIRLCRRAGTTAVEIADTGAGMSRDELRAALRPFGQVDDRLARKHEGAGLGLPIARRLIEAHDGTLEILSRPGRGTTAIVRLPAAESVRRAA